MQGADGAAAVQRAAAGQRLQHVHAKVGQDLVEAGSGREVGGMLKQEKDEGRLL
jgi:hypothetical protein